MLYCQQHPQFLSHFGDGEMENLIKAGLSVMVENSSGFDEGKSLILKVAHSKLNFPQAADGKLDCYWTENSGFMLDFICVEITDTTAVCITLLP